MDDVDMNTVNRLQEYRTDDGGRMLIGIFSDIGKCWTLASFLRSKYLDVDMSSDEAPYMLFCKVPAAVCEEGGWNDE